VEIERPDVVPWLLADGHHKHDVPELLALRADDRFLRDVERGGHHSRLPSNLWRALVPAIEANALPSPNLAGRGSDSSA